MKQISNCWEYKKCGREPGGLKVSELGVCPASTEKRMDTEHQGKNAGRTCWIVSGTYCKGEVQGSFAKKMGECMHCEFYQMVKQEEYPNFKMSSLLLTKIKDA